MKIIYIFSILLFLSVGENTVSGQSGLFFNEGRCIDTGSTFDKEDESVTSHPFGTETSQEDDFLSSPFTDISNPSGVLTAFDPNDEEEWTIGGSAPLGMGLDILILLSVFYLVYIKVDRRRIVK